MNTFAFDYETFYSKTYSVKDLGNWAYTQHEEFDPFLLSVAGDNGYEWVGHPTKFDWAILHGQRLVAHNAPFEFAVTERLRELGVVPKDWNFVELYDTADLAAYLGVPRNLAGAALHLLGLKLDKGTRDKAKGLHWHEMDPAFQQEMTRYGLNDSKVELRLWLEHSHKWPIWERQLSVATREMCWQGLPADKAAARKAVKKLHRELSITRIQIPWAVDENTPVLSKIEAAKECRKHGVPPPSSMAKNSEEFDAWLAEYGARFPWAKAMGDYRSMNMLMRKMETLCERTDDENIFRYGLKYFGAHTGRDSGDTGFNPQNLPRADMFGIDVRGTTISAPEGYTLGIADLSAIEPCVLNCLAGDEEICALLRTGMDPYEADARVNYGYTNPKPLKEVDSKLRQYMKVDVLACGYGAGPPKVQLIAKTMLSLDLSLEKCEEIVKKFRSRKFIPNLWKDLEEAMRASSPGNFEMELPSGRVMTYREVRNLGSLSAVIPRMGKMLRLKWWGGSLTENLVQATARDVFMWQVLKLLAADLNVILRAHDEVVMLLPIATAEADLKKALKIMSTPPEWMPDLPVRAEGHLSQKYKK